MAFNKDFNNHDEFDDDFDDEFNEFDDELNDEQDEEKIIFNGNFDNERLQEIMDDDEDFFENSGIFSASMGPRSIAGTASMALSDLYHFDFVHYKILLKTYKQAICIAKQSWFWRFKSNSRKIKEINEIYYNIINVTDPEAINKGKQQKKKKS